MGANNFSLGLCLHGVVRDVVEGGGFLHVVALGGSKGRVMLYGLLLVFEVGGVRRR